MARKTMFEDELEKEVWLDVLLEKLHELGRRVQAGSGRLKERSRVETGGFHCCNPSKSAGLCLGG